MSSWSISASVEASELGSVYGDADAVTLAVGDHGVGADVAFEVGVDDFAIGAERDRLIGHWSLGFGPDAGGMPGPFALARWVDLGGGGHWRIGAMPLRAP